MGILDNNPQHKSFEGVCNSLRDQRKPELALFVELMGNIQKHMSLLSAHKVEIQQHLEQIYEKLSY